MSDVPIHPVHPVHASHGEDPLVGSMGADANSICYPVVVPVVIIRSYVTYNNKDKIQNLSTNPYIYIYYIYIYVRVSSRQNLLNLSSYYHRMSLNMGWPYHFPVFSNTTVVTFFTKSLLGHPTISPTPTRPTTSAMRSMPCFLCKAFIMGQIIGISRLNC